MNASVARGPLAAYRARLAGGALKPDVMQARAAERLEALHQALAAWRPDARAGWLQRFGLAPRPVPPRGVYLHGPVGRGKSLLMDLFFEAAAPAHKRRVHFHAFMLEVHARLHRWRQKAPGEREGKDPIPPLAAKLASEAALLCFDEFQVTNIADATILGRLLANLFERGVVMVATSNCAPDELYAGGLQRVLFEPAIALLKEKLDVFPLDGGRDYRRALIKGMKVYYSPLGAASSAALDAAFKHLTDAAGAPLEFQVQGRVLTVPRAAKNVAMMHFAELCERPVGAADYLAIAERFHTLILDGVRIIGPDERDVARRFITLIDALYERRTRLICAAAVAPEALYPVGQHTDEFRRTLSRLHEMQSEAYLAGPLPPAGSASEAATGGR